MNAHAMQAIHYVRKCNAEEAAKLNKETVATTESPVTSTTALSTNGARSLFRKLQSQGEPCNATASKPRASPEREENKTVWLRQFIISQSIHTRALSRR
jgi:hypothetical protein